MNILELQDNLKDLPDSALMREMQMPSGSAPQFLVLSELKRRKRMRDEFKRQEASNMPTVAEEVVTAAGMPQQGIMQAARAMAPNTNMAQNTGMDTAAPVPATRAPQMMADGGVVKMQTGGITEYPSINPLIGNVDLSQIAAMLQSGADKEALIANYGADAVREAESMLLPFMKKSIGQIPLGRYPSTFSRRDIRKMEDQGIFGNKSYRNVGGEGIGSVSADVEDFTATDTNYTGQGGTLPAELIPMQSILASDPVTRIQADRAGISVDEYISQMSPEARAQNLLRASGQGPEFDKGAELAAYGEFIGTPSMYRPEAGMPTQEDLDLRAQEAAAEDVFPEYVSPNDQDREYNIMQELQRQAAIERGGYEAAARAEDAPTFTGDVLPFLGDASVAAGKSLYNSLFPQKTVGPDDVIAELREQSEVYNPSTTVIDYDPTNVDQAALQLKAEQKANQELYTDRLNLERQIDRLAGTSETPDDFERLAALKAQLESMGGSTEKAPVTAQLLAAEENFGRLLTDDYKAASMAPVARDLKVATDTVSQLQQTLEVASAENKPIIEQRLVDETANLAAAQSAYDNAQENLATDSSLNVVEIPDMVSGGVRRVGPDSIIAELREQEQAAPVTIAEQAAEAAAEIAPLADERRDDDPELKLPTVPTDDNTTNVKPITDGGEGGAGFGSTDSRIAKMLSERQKEAESDKWMALAYAGMELMKPTATFGEGLGKAGQAGLGYLTKSKKGLRDFETDMLKLQTTLDAARLRSQGTGKTSATAYAALERAYSDALTAATENPTAPNLARLEELEAMINEARATQFGTVTAGNTNSGVIKTPSAQAG